MKNLEQANVEVSTEAARIESPNKDVQMEQNIIDEPFDIPTSVQKELDNAKEEAGRALEGWMAAREEAERARSEIEKLRGNERERLERAEQAQAELKTTGEELAKTEAKLGEAHGEVARMREEVSLAEAKAAELHANNQLLQDELTLSHEKIEKAEAEVARAQKNSLLASLEQLAARQEALKGWQELMLAERERLNTDEENLNAKLQKAEDPSQYAIDSSNATLESGDQDTQDEAKQEGSGPLDLDDENPEHIHKEPTANLVDRENQDQIHADERSPEREDQSVNRVTSKNLTPLKVAITRTHPVRNDRSVKAVEPEENSASQEPEPQSKLEIDEDSVEWRDANDGVLKLL